MKPLTNKFAGKCSHCGEHVAAGEGWWSKAAGVGHNVCPKYKPGYVKPREHNPSISYADARHSFSFYDGCES